MRLVIDIEANGLKPTQIWVIVCKDLDTGDLHIFREPTTNVQQKQAFEEVLRKAVLVVGHNVLEYDLPVISNLLGIKVEPECVVRDTLILSRLFVYSRASGHSIEAYGEGFGYPKIAFNDFSKYSQEMEDYCVRDVEICERIYSLYSVSIHDPEWAPAIQLEHDFQYIVNALHNNGFSFNVARARELLTYVEGELSVLDKDILSSFPPREVLIREFTPKLTKFGTISKTSVPKSLRDQIHTYEAGKTYKQTRLVPFNPSSPKQVVQVLNEAGWKPVDKTKTHVETERKLNKLLRARIPPSPVDLETIRAKLLGLKVFGWKVNENNLGTLPESAPAPARSLAKRILLESRRRTFTEWLSLVHEDGRIHGKFLGIGAWTHRMAHQSPNTANIPNKFDTEGKIKLLGEEMRSLWQAPRNRLLVGVDAEGIQLRIFAHYIDDPEFTEALVKGKKDDKSDPHSLNQRILGSVCKSRAAAKRFIYALLLGAGLGKLSEILSCSELHAREALSRLLERYGGYAFLKEQVIPQDARRGFFIGLDGRKCPIPSEDVGVREHLAMSGYLQNGEAVVMKRACIKWHRLCYREFVGDTDVSLELTIEKLKKVLAFLVNFVHDEWQTETKNDMAVAIKIAKLQADSLRLVGEELNLKCPLAGSYWNDDHQDYTIGTNWSVTH